MKISVNDILQLKNKIFVCSIDSKYLIKLENYKTLSLQEFEKNMDKLSGNIIVYCANWNCSASTRYSESLKKYDNLKVYEFKGGMLEWAMRNSIGEKECKFINSKDNIEINNNIILSNIINYYNDKL